MKIARTSVPRASDLGLDTVVASPIRVAWTIQHWKIVGRPAGVGFLSAAQLFEIILDGIHLYMHAVFAGPLHRAQSMLFILMNLLKTYFFHQVEVWLSPGLIGLVPHKSYLFYRVAFRKMYMLC